MKFPIGVRLKFPNDPVIYTVSKVTQHEDYIIKWISNGNEIAMPFTKNFVEEYFTLYDKPKTGFSKFIKRIECSR